MDFETAMHAAWAFVFGESCQLVGCLFHFKQALWRRAQKLGLVAKEVNGGYWNETRKLIKQIGYLCFENRSECEEGVEPEHRENTEYSKTIMTFILIRRKRVFKVDFSRNFREAFLEK